MASGQTAVTAYPGPPDTRLPDHRRLKVDVASGDGATAAPDPDRCVDDLTHLAKAAAIRE